MQNRFFAFVCLFLFSFVGESVWSAKKSLSKGNDDGFCEIGLSNPGSSLWRRSISGGNYPVLQALEAKAKQHQYSVRLFHSLADRNLRQVPMLNDEYPRLPHFTFLVIGIADERKLRAIHSDQGSSVLQTVSEDLLDVTKDEDVPMTLSFQGIFSGFPGGRALPPISSWGFVTRFPKKYKDFIASLEGLAWDVQWNQTVRQGEPIIGRGPVVVIMNENHGNAFAQFLVYEQHYSQIASDGQPF